VEHVSYSCYYRTQIKVLTVSVFSFILIVWLVYSEVNYYLDSKFQFKFSPDTDFDAKLKINVDITVAMPCSSKYQKVLPALY
jgi:hypothetical protein